MKEKNELLNTQSLTNEKNIEMNQSLEQPIPENILVDVVALSKKECEEPIRVKLRFSTTKNFIGTPINGYELSNPKELCLLSRKAAEDLCKVQNYLNTQGLSLYLYDAYRPKRAVTHFWEWSQSKQSLTQEALDRKSKHYPLVPKEDFFKRGYVAKNSTHCYGNTLDTEVIVLTTGRPLFMGARISYMGGISHSVATLDSIRDEWKILKEKNEFQDIKKQFKRATDEEWQEENEELYLQMALDNRRILSTAMQQFGFLPYEKEWWHYSHPIKESDEPMDMPITSNLMGLGVV